jgi:hypothetical protein
MSLANERQSDKLIYHQAFLISDAPAGYEPTTDDICDKQPTADRCYQLYRLTQNSVEFMHLSRPDSQYEKADGNWHEIKQTWNKNC